MKNDSRVQIFMKQYLCGVSNEIEYILVWNPG